MTTALLVATARAEGSDAPAALLRSEGTTVLVRLATHLREAGAGGLVVLTRPDWATACKEAIEEAALEADVLEGRDLPELLSVVADVAASNAGDLVVARCDIVVHASAVAGLLADPRIATGVLATRVPKFDDEAGARIEREGLVGGGDAPCLRMERGRGVSAESAYHATLRATHRSLGILKVAASDRRAVERCARDLVEIVRNGLPEPWRQELARKREDVWRDDAAAEAATLDVVGLLLVALVRSDVTVRGSYLRELRWARVSSERDVEEARASLAEVDEDDVLLRSAVKAEDGFFTTFFVSPYSKYVARWAARRGLTPNQVTTVSLLLGGAAAAAFAAGTRGWLIAGAILLQISFTADCVDGQLARYSRRFSGLGAWLDSIFDRTKEYAVFAGLAAGAVRTGSGDGVWLLAGAALCLQTVRHLLDFSFAATQHERIAVVKRVPLERPWDAADGVESFRAAAAAIEAERIAGRRAPDLDAPPADAAGRLGRLAVRASRRLEVVRGMKFVKRFVAFPIGERFAAISLAAAVSGARTVFVVVLAWGAIGGLYTAAGRILRSVA